MMQVKGPFLVLKTTWEEFVQETSIAGLANSGKTRNGFIRRTFWQIAFIIMFTISLKQIIEVFKSYYEFPVTTSVTVNGEQQLYFPAVTICNQNRVQCCNLQLVYNECKDNYTICEFESANDTRFQIFDFLLEKCGVTSESDNGAVTTQRTDSNNDGNQGNENNDEQNTDVNNDAKPNTDRGARRKRAFGEPPTGEPNTGPGAPEGPEGKPPPDNYGEQTEAAAAEAEFLSQYMGLSENVRQMIGHDFSDFIKSCTFRGSTCLDSNNFRVESYPGYGNCFIFNSQNNFNDSLAGKRTLALTGPTFGLSLVLNLNQKYYLRKGGTQKGGARVTVHDTELRPLVDEDGQDVTPSQITSIAVKETVISRQKAPYTSKCMSEWAETPYRHYLDLRKAGRYSISECKRACFFSKVIETCSCFYPEYTDFDESINGTLPCNGTQYSTDANCTSKVLYDIDSGTHTCLCGVGCLDRHYEKQLSVATWPSKQYLDDAAVAYGFVGAGTDACAELNQNNGRKKRQEPPAPGAPTGPSDEQREQLAENLVRVDVYFETLSVQNITETPTYDTYSFLSSLGGAASLFLGMAIFMVLEVFEFAIDLIINMCHYCSKGH